MKGEKKRQAQPFPRKVESGKGEEEHDHHKKCKGAGLTIPSSQRERGKREN